jgi:L-iditol 2-dehydrogenase
MDQGALVEPTSVAMHAIRRAGDIKGLKVLVLGAGTIGNLVAQAATASGATAVMVSDVSDYKLEKARHCGIQFVINPQRENLDKAILKNFGPDRADLIIECVGVPDTIAQAIPSARKGSTIVVVGVFAMKPEVDFGLVQDHELHIIGSLMYQRVDYERTIELVARGKINVNELITHRFPFNHYLDAYHAIEAAQGKYMKVIVDV